MSEMAETAPTISVITCSHNPRADYISQVLAALASQSLDPSSWEFLLVDSASTEPLADRIDLSWHHRSRVVREEEPGLTRARLRGIEESSGDLLIFVDDDNVLDSNFLEEALRIYSSRPEIGSWSGATRPGFESTPEAWTERYWGNLVIREVHRDSWSNLPMLPETMPCGAGLCVRRAVADYYSMLHSTGRRSFPLDRVGTSLLSGGDNDLAACACDIGLGVGVFGAMTLTHLIPPNRLDEEYLVRLTEGIALSAVLLRSLRDPASAAQRPSRKRRIADLVRLTLKNRRERAFYSATLRGERTAREMLRRLGTSSS